MSKRARRGDVVEIEWADAQHLSFGWATPSEYIRGARSPEAFTAGYLIGNAGKHVVLALTLDPPNGKVTQAMSIPKGMIRKTTVLGRASKRVRKALRP